MSETFITMVLLTLSGGFQDAYTFICRDQVFANAQTGNIVLLAASICEGNWLRAMQYLVPVLAFAVGVYTAEVIRHNYHHRSHIHWRQAIVAIEILLLFLVGFCPSKWNPAANILVSFVCALQLQAFRKVNGNAYASTMCIGNLRSGVENFYRWRHDHSPESKQRAAAYFRVISIFALGAAAGCILTAQLGINAIWCSCGLLGISFLLMIKTEDQV